MNEQLRGNRKSPLLLSVGIACLAILFFAPVITSGDPAEFNLLEPALKIAVCGAVSAWLFQRVGWLLGCLSAIPVVLLSFFLTDGSPYLTLASLLYLPLGVTLALVSADKLSRSAAVAVSAGIGVVLSLSLLLLSTYLTQGSLSFPALEAQYDFFFAFLRDSIKESFVISVLGNDVSFVTDENAVYYTKQVLSMMPTLMGVAFITVGYASSWLYKFLLKCNRDALPHDELWNVDPPPISAIFLILAALVLLIDGGLPLYVQIGLVSPGLFVLPGFCLSGLCRSFAIRIVDGLPRPRILRPVLLFLSGISAGFLGLVFISAVFGIIDCFRKAFPRKTNETNS